MPEIELPPGIALNDPRLIAAEAPYTFEMPHPDELAALRPGDGIKAIFRQTEGETKYSAERIWVQIEAIEGGVVTGTLDNEPTDMPFIKVGDRVRLPLTHAIATDFRPGERRPKTPMKRQYWDRCFVDACIVDGRCHVDYLYRDEPDPTPEGDNDPDSGWRFRGTNEAIAEDERLGKSAQYIAIGIVLNRDDRWMHLIDSEPGRAFQWDPGAQDYIELDQT